MELSGIRSAFSEDSPRGRECGVREMQLAGEVERLRRRNGLVERAREVLEEELQLFREEVSSKNHKIQQLTQQLGLPPAACSTISSSAATGASAASAELILVEQQEQLAMAGQALRSQARRVEELEEQNRQLREEVADMGSLVRQLRESSRAQLAYHSVQLAALQQELQEKDQQLANSRLFMENLAQKENAKWQQVTEGLREQLHAAEEKARAVFQRQETYAEERRRLKQQNQGLQQQIEGLSSRVGFLESLLEEAKGAFIDAQLQQQEQLEREEKEKREYRRRNQLLKTQIRSLKAHDSASTCEPSNKSTRTTSTISVTPFRTSSARPHPHP